MTGFCAASIFAIPSTLALLTPSAPFALLIASFASAAASAIAFFSLSFSLADFESSLSTLFAASVATLVISLIASVF